VDFQIEGQRFTAINGGPEFTFDEAISFLVTCETQDEIDELWDKLVEGGGEHGPCGWLKDKYGLSWQIAPAEMDQLMAGPDAEGSKRAFHAMMKMSKIDIAELKKAYAGK
jgi:predicted 3-demethylubiquinone-9 3-methyltransferase (glyoxalase superfamily)